MKLDLTARKEKYLDLTMLDGTMVQIKKPSKEMILELDSFNINKVKAEKSEDVFNAIEDITVKILNCNVGMRTFNTTYLHENGYDYEICGAIINAYEGFLKEVMSNPN